MRAKRSVKLIIINGGAMLLHTSKRTFDFFSVDFFLAHLLGVVLKYMRNNKIHK